ncbi:beta-eliminating lyase-related protein [Vibrio sp. ZSDZ34]|uniref:Beta-eliminating lyase-related protein n=1 Tax=Vibrio gelatinilyticus TaxID=2893468 RepID=A0A9X1WCE8_9VIBR|nr:beta-eliminating lyase-related protein [Vibrio gelatinilyticus]MCJ2378362.1 beta-eliminating lyase-related protein [Vibrio gelatinilyticus]
MKPSARHLCHTILSGNKELAPHQLFSDMAKWCLDNDVAHDTYGEGELLQAFEKEIAQLLGFESALFIVTGTMNQPTALQLACENRASNLVAMHSTSHILQHEAQGFQLQKRFNVIPIGHQYSPWTLNDLKASPEEFAAALYELPMREIGGQLPQWQELQDIKHYCQQKCIHFHMDGARLWECAAYYQQPYHEIAKGFDSVYVSLYKGIGGLGGSMLVGSKSFIDRARIWVRRQGGDVYHRTPYIVSAKMAFDERLAQMPKLFERTQQIYALIQADYPELTLNPEMPQCNMLHLYLPFSVQQTEALCDALAREQGVWFGNPQPTALSAQSKVEWYVGETLLTMSDQQLRSILDWLMENASLK